MAPERGSRLPYQESYAFLQREGYRRAGEAPPIPERRPQFDDDDLRGVRFFRTRLAGGRLDDLTLPRTYIAFSEVATLSFRNTDLSESTLCWNDFNSVSFADACLLDCDLRASIFREASFVRANLQNADLRHSTFTKCDFTEPLTLQLGALTFKDPLTLHSGR